MAIENVNVLVLKVEKLLMKNFSYLVVSEDRRSCILIDPAWESEKIENALQVLNISLTGILLTHSHYDHVNLVEYFATKHNCNVWMSCDEMNTYQYECRNLKSFVHEELFYVYGIPIKAYITPGHTKGSTCFQIKNHLFTGDTVFIEGCGVCTGFGSSPYDMYSSLRFLTSRVSKDTLIYPGHSYGHSPGKTFGFVLDNNIYFNFETVESFVKFRMRGGQHNLYEFK